MAAKILIIEDQESIVKLLVKRLKSQGYEVLTATDGKRGLEMAKSGQPDLIVTDLAMPGMTGNVIIRVLRQSEEYKKIPIIMLSAFIRGTEHESHEFPADAYIKKPFDAQMLLDKIKELLAAKND
jgi:CheY-like chemotaxis protein